MATAVDIFIKDDSVDEDPISGVVVAVYNATTLALVAAAVTDGEGRAAFLLPGTTSPGTTYEVRAWKLGVIFSNPFRIQVIEPVVTTNQFDISGTLIETGVSLDPRCCRLTGRLMNLKNQPLSNTLIRVTAKGEFQKPKVVDGNLIAAEALEVRTNSQGYVSFDLLRGGEYYVMFAGEEDTVWNILVPDRSSANLVDLMFPRPSSVEWEFESVEMDVGDTELVGVEVEFTNFQTVSNDLANWLKAESTDTSVVTATILSDGKVQIVAVGSGSATVQLRVLEDFLPHMIPDPSDSVLELTLPVTVE